MAETPESIGKYRVTRPLGKGAMGMVYEGFDPVIEVDGGTHGSESERSHDARRGAYMRLRGWRVMRFWNYDIYRNLNEVADAIFAAAALASKPCAGAVATPSVIAREERALYAPYEKVRPLARQRWSRPWRSWWRCS